jgi:hypothetical protein
MQQRSASSDSLPLSERVSQLPTAPPPAPEADCLDLCSALEGGDEAQPAAGEPPAGDPPADAGVSWELADGEASRGDPPREVRLNRKPTPSDLPPLRRRRFVPPIPREEPE